MKGDRAWVQEFNGLQMDGALYGFAPARAGDFAARSELELRDLRRMGRRVGPQARRGEISCRTWLDVADRYCDFDSAVAGGPTLADEHRKCQKSLDDKLADVIKGPVRWSMPGAWSDSQVKLPAKPKPDAFAGVVHEMQQHMAASMGVPVETWQRDYAKPTFSMTAAIMRRDKERQDAQKQANREWLSLQDEIQRHASTSVPVAALAQRCGATSADVRRAIRALAQRGVIVPVKRAASRRVSSERSVRSPALDALAKSLKMANELSRMGKR